MRLPVGHAYDVSKDCGRQDRGSGPRFDVAGCRRTRSNKGHEVRNHDLCHRDEESCFNSGVGVFAAQGKSTHVALSHGVNALETRGVKHVADFLFFAAHDHPGSFSFFWRGSTSPLLCH